jgi:superfamily I DNA and/or RNA helicase
VLIVAPYNVQVAELKKRLSEHRERIGAVDKFQGKQAPIVVYSMASSSAEDAPRGMAFLCASNVRSRTRQ